MKEGQEAIYYITADSLAAAKSSPQLEIFRKKGIEVLLLVDRVDEWMLSHLYEFEGKPLQSVAKGASTWASCRTRKRRRPPRKPPSLQAGAGALKTALKDRAKDVRVTTRLVDSPACIVVDEGDMSGHLARCSSRPGRRAEVAADPGGQPEHALVKRLESERALRRPGADPVRPGAAGRRRAARRPGGLRAAREPLLAA
jgi:molecular chaperone HtpG